MTQFTVKPLNDIISDLLLNVADNIDDVTDLNVGSVLRQMLEAVAAEIDLLYGELQNIYDGSRVDTATGTDLEQIGAIVGVTRKTGTKASGFVTFQRNTVAPADFVISINSIVSTQPNTGDAQLRFLVRANTTFLADVVGDTQLYTDGIYDYALSERIIDSIQAFTGTVLTLPYNFVQNTDYQVVSVTNNLLIDVTTIQVADTCDTATWTSSVNAAAETVNSSNKRQGTNSLNLGKIGVSNDTASYEKVLGAAADSTNRDFHFYFYVANAPTLAKIKELTVLYGSGGNDSNSKQFTFAGSSLVVGWNLLRVDRTSQNLIQTGFPSAAAINFVRLSVVTNNASDTIALGDIGMDYFFFAQNSFYNGDLVRWLVAGTRPDNATNFSVTYKPLSKEVLCDAEVVGSDYNVGLNKIVFKVSNLPNIDTVNNYVVMSGGSNVETDTELRERIKNSSVTGFATVQALENAVLAVTGVASVTVNDLPLKNAVNEAHEFVSPTTVYKLDFEVAQDNVNLVITGTVSGSPFTFVNGIDYVLTADSEIEWLLGGTSPDNNTFFFVDYDYKHLGHVDIFVSGVEIPLPPSVLTAVTTAVDNTKAAGVIATISEPTVVTVNVTATIVVDTGAGYNAPAVQAEVADNIRAYINSLSVGQDIYRAELIRVIQETDGVINSTVTVPASDVTIDVDEVPKAGTVNIS